MINVNLTKEEVYYIKNALWEWIYYYEILIDKIRVREGDIAGVICDKDKYLKLYDKIKNL